MRASVKRLCSAVLSAVLVFSAGAALSPATHAAGTHTAISEITTQYQKNTKDLHPSIMYTAEDLPALRTKTKDGVSASAMAALKVLADQYVNQSASPYRYQGAGISGRMLQLQVTTLCFYGEMLGSSGQKYIDHAVDMMISAAKQGGVDVYLKENDALCLGDFASTYAIGYDWLYDYMSKSERELIYDHMMELGQWLYQASTTGVKPGTSEKAAWAEANQYRSAWNWNTVAHTGLTLIAMATGEHPEWMTRGLERINEYYKYSKNDAGLPQEGLGYTGYGMRLCVVIDAALVQHTDTSLIDRHEDVKNFLTYYAWSMLPTASNESISVNQGSTLWNFSIPYYMANRYGDEEAVWAVMADADILSGGKGLLAGATNYVWGGNGFDLPQMIIFEDKSLSPKVPLSGGLTDFGGQEVICRSGFGTGKDTKDIALLSLRIGTKYSQIWHHPDSASITFHAFDESFVIDPGTNKRDAAHHNGPVLNGATPSSIKATDKAKLVDAKELSAGVYLMEADTRQAYTNSTNVSRADRTVLFVDGAQPYVFVLDDVCTKKDVSITTNWYTASDNKLSAAGKGVRISAPNGAACTLNVFNSDSGTKITNYSTSDKYVSVLSPEGTDHLQGIFLAAGASSSAAATAKCTYGDDGSMTLTVTRKDAAGEKITDTITATAAGITFITTATAAEKADAPDPGAVSGLLARAALYHLTKKP